jgi:ATP-dependent exoDNAse (exonuclease V) alpha subunit
LTPIDLIYDNRIIKRKSLDYGYCISAHKSQSSTYRIVLIDMENIFRCTNKEELRQMQYVALSRTEGEIILYQKNE